MKVPSVIKKKKKISIQRKGSIQKFGIGFVLKNNSIMFGIPNHYQTIISGAHHYRIIGRIRSKNMYFIFMPVETLYYRTRNCINFLNLLFRYHKDVVIIQCHKYKSIGVDICSNINLLKSIVTYRIIYISNELKMSNISYSIPLQFP